MALDTRIPMAVPNVLAMGQQVAQTNALNANALGQGFNAIQQGLEAPMRRNALALDNRNAELAQTQAEQQMLGQVLDGMARLPEGSDLQSAWMQAKRHLVGNGVFQEGELPDVFDNRIANELAVIASMPAEQLTDYERQIRDLNSDNPMRRQAAGVALGMVPDANAMLRGQTGDKVPSGYREGPNGTLEYIPGGPADPKTRDALRGNGTTMTYNPETGQMEVQIGGSAKLGRAGENEIDKRMIDTGDQLARLERIRVSSSDPIIADMNTLEGKLKEWGYSWADFLDPKSLSGEQAEYLEKVTTARANVLENLNFTIKEITGAAMGKDEAVRIMATMPNMDDSPVQFKAKLNRVLERGRAALARYHMWKANGSVGNPEDFAPLPEIESMMEKRRNDYKSAVDEGRMTLEEANGLFVSEFGL